MPEENKTAVKRRRPKGSGTIRLRSDGRWEGFAAIGRNSATGRTIYSKPVYGKTQREVNRKLRQLTVDLDNGVYFEPSKITVAQWFDLWLTDYTGSMTPNTITKYKSVTENHIKPAFAKTKLCKLTPVMVQHFINEKAVSKPKPKTSKKPKKQEEPEKASDKPYSPKTIKDIHGVLHAGLKTACEIDYIPKNPADRTKLPKLTDAPIRPLDKSEIKIFLDSIAGSEYESIFRLAIYTGMRESELVGLSWDRVDLTAGVITIDRQLQRKDGVYSFVPPKWGKIHAVSLAPSVIALLQAERKQQLENRLRAGTAWSNPLDLVFTNEIGKNRVAQTVSQRFKKAARAAGLPDACFHDLRHTFAVNALQAGIDVKTVSESMGHRSVAFTMDRYMDVTSDMQRSSAEKMEAFIQSI